MHVAAFAGGILAASDFFNKIGVYGSRRGKDRSSHCSRHSIADEQGRRPVFGNLEKFQTDPHWRDLVLFYEYFHGDSGTGVGASHQTGWTGLVTKLLQQSGECDALGGSAGDDVAAD